MLVCRDEGWVEVKRCVETERKDLYQSERIIRFGVGDWFKIEDIQNPNFYDVKRLEDFILAFVTNELRHFSEQQRAYKEFTKDCGVIEVSRFSTPATLGKMLKAFNLINDQQDCLPCPFPEVQCISHDFSTAKWDLGGGSGWNAHGAGCRAIN
jgi:hypothetical protein